MGEKGKEGDRERRGRALGSKSLLIRDVNSQYSQEIGVFHLGISSLKYQCSLFF